VGELREEAAPAANFDGTQLTIIPGRRAPPYANHPWVLRHIRDEVKYPYS
jgi:hypothetical protein